MEKLSQLFEKQILQWAEDSINHDRPDICLEHAIDIICPQIVVKFVMWCKLNFKCSEEAGLDYWEDPKGIINKDFNGIYLTDELWLVYLKQKVQHEKFLL